MGGLGVKTTKRQLQNCGEKGDKHFATVNKLCSPYLGLSLRNVIIFFLTRVFQTGYSQLV